jgi:hypothetical protein
MVRPVGDFMSRPSPDRIPAVNVWSSEETKKANAEYIRSQNLAIDAGARWASASF